MKQTSHLKGENQTYFAGQWAEAGVYRCLDPCPPGEEIVVLSKEGILPDPTHGWVARFHRVRGREAERLLAIGLLRRNKSGERCKYDKVESLNAVKGRRNGQETQAQA